MDEDVTRTTADVEGWKVGDVVKTFDGEFNSATILGFFRYHGEGPWNAELARPYLYAHDLGTPCAYPLLGYERYTSLVSSLKRVEPPSKYRETSGPSKLIASEFVKQARG